MPGESKKEPEVLVYVTLTMSEADAVIFVDDWEYDRAGPVRTGGFQENPVTVLAVDVRKEAHEGS